MNKKIIRLLLHVSALAAYLIVCTACPGPHPDEPDYVEVSVKTLDFSWQKGESKDMTIETNTDWTLTVTGGKGEGVNWLSASKIKGKGGSTNVTFTIMEDYLDEEKARECSVLVVAGDDSKTIKVIQSSHPITYHLTAYPQILVFGHQEGSESITVDTNDEWTSVSDAEWCVVQKDGGSSAFVKVERNTTQHLRVATITVTGAKSQLTATIEVTQRATSDFSTDPFGQDKNIDDYVPYLFDVSPTALTFEAAGATGAISVTGNDDWTATSSQPEWCKLSVAGGNAESIIEVTVERNDGRNQRQAVIIVTGSHTGKAIEVSVTQQGNSEFEITDYNQDKDIDLHYEFAAEPTAMVFKVEGETKELSISGNDDWTATLDDESWCTLSGESGYGPATVYVTAKESKSSTVRSTTITLKGTHTDKTITIYVTQEGTGYAFDAAPQSIDFTAAGGTKDINITGNDEWTVVMNGAAWCTVSEDSGTGAATLSVTATRNDNTVQRATTVTLKGKNTGKTITVNVTQKGNSDIDREGYEDDKDLDLEVTFDASPTMLTYEAQGGTKSISITGNDEWTATSSATDWCSVSKAGGTGAATVSVSVSKNTATAQRATTVILRGKSTGKTVTVNVTQKGVSDFNREDYGDDKDLDEQYSLGVTPTALTLEAQGETKGFSISGNDEWTATSGNGTWCTLSKANGTGEAVVYVTATKNTSGSQRTTAVTVTGKHTEKIFTVSITQKGSSGFDRDGYTPDKDLDDNYAFNVSLLSFDFNATGATGTVTISGNDDWTAKLSDPTWCRFEATSGTAPQILSIKATRNDTGRQRSATVTIKGKNTGKEFVINVTQKGATSFERDGYGSDKNLDK